MRCYVMLMLISGSGLVTANDNVLKDFRDCQHYNKNNFSNQSLKGLKLKTHDFKITSKMREAKANNLHLSGTVVSNKIRFLGLKSQPYEAEGLDLQDSQLHKITFRLASLKNADMHNVSFDKRVKFDRCDLSKSNWKHAVIKKNLHLWGSDISGIDFRVAQFLGKKIMFHKSDAIAYIDGHTLFSEDQIQKIEVRTGTYFEYRNEDGTKTPLSAREVIAKLRENLYNAPALTNSVQRHGESEEFISAVDPRTSAQQQHQEQQQRETTTKGLYPDLGADMQDMFIQD